MPRPIEEWLVEEANARGYLGASGAYLPERPPEVTLSDEDVVVALLSPHAAADGRILKLVIRMIQSGKLDARVLALRARRERSDWALYWLLQLVPYVERLLRWANCSRRCDRQGAIALLITTTTPNG